MEQVLNLLLSTRQTLFERGRSCQRRSQLPSPKERRSERKQVSEEEKPVSVGQYTCRYLRPRFPPRGREVVDRCHGHCVPLTPRQTCLPPLGIFKPGQTRAIVSESTTTLRHVLQFRRPRRRWNLRGTGRVVAAVVLSRARPSVRPRGSSSSGGSRRSRRRRERHSRRRSGRRGIGPRRPPPSRARWVRRRWWGRPGRDR